MEPPVTKGAWLDEITALRERIDRLPDPEHPAVKGLIRKHDALLFDGLALGYTTPEEAARA